MTFGEQIAEFARKVNDVSLKRYRPDQVKRWLNQGNYDISTKVEPLEKTVLTNIVSAQADYLLPLDFISIKQIEYINASGTVSTLIETNYKDLNILRTKTTPSAPTYFLNWENAATLYPTPASNITNGLRLFYYRLHALLEELTDISEFPEGYHDIAVLYACYRAKQTDAEALDPKASNSASSFRDEYYKRLEQMSAELATRRQDRMPKFRNVEQFKGRAVRIV